MNARFPAPAGPLTFAQSRRALAAWAMARQRGGRFVLGGEAGAADADLAWLGLDHDGELRGPARAGRHAEAADRLRASGRLYPCLETDEELAWKARLRTTRGQPAIYDRAMLALTPAQLASARSHGKQPYWRFLLADGERRWRDRVLGRQAVRLADHSDPILVRADGTATPALSGAVDDIDAEVGILVRDAQQVTATALHLDIVAALGTDPAGWALLHVAGDEGRSPTLRRLRQDGILPEAVAAVLAGTERPESPAGLAAGFLPERMAQPLDPALLGPANRLALGALGFEAVRDRLPADATPAFWEAVRGHVELPAEAAQWLDAVQGRFEAPDVSPALARAALDALPAEPWAPGTWESWRDAVGDEAGLRRALVGDEPDMPLAALLPVIGRDPAALRLRRLLR